MASAPAIVVNFAFITSDASGAIRLDANKFDEYALRTSGVPGDPTRFPRRINVLTHIQ
jgi:hypothetical protein